MGIFLNTFIARNKFSSTERWSQMGNWLGMSRRRGQRRRIKMHVWVITDCTFKCCGFIGDSSSSCDCTLKLSHRDRIIISCVKNRSLGGDSWWGLREEEVCAKFSRSLWDIHRWPWNCGRMWGFEVELRSVGWLTNRPDNSANDKLKIPAYHPNPSYLGRWRNYWEHL